MSNDRVFALVLAAGLSRRLGRPKQLLQLGGKPLVCHVVEAALAAPIDGVVVVIGSHASEVEQALLDYQTYRVFNPHFSKGQGNSLSAGVRAIPSTVDAIVVLLADMPGIRTEAIAAVVERWRQTRAPAVMARYTDGDGHPVLFDHSAFTDLARLQGDSAGREVLRRLGDQVERVDVPLPGPPLDVDTEEDWERLQASWG
ncbi:MAG TPA: nucleotidyltransferase family protein [Thermomicrobiales bacterium]|nr:nucleotidyltransferase family protein [Thermomicrobiales bacterium]